MPPYTTNVLSDREGLHTDDIVLEIIYMLLDNHHNPYQAKY